MSEQEEKNDRFWLYVGLTVCSLIITIALVKKTENEKFAPIKHQINEENAQMKIRILG